MNRTDRLLAILLALQTHGTRRASDLADLFETSQRTIYRDMQALSEAGVPLVAIPGQGYSLMEGYFLPPLTFTAVEATMLLLGSTVMAQTFDAQFRQAAETAGQKIIGVLPAELRQDVEDLRDRMRFVDERPEQPLAILPSLRSAILERRAVQFRYHTRYPTAPTGNPVETPRTVDPYTIVHRHNAWYLTGFDHLRGDVRTFRLDRMDEVTLLDRRFDRPPDAHLLGRPEPDRHDRTVEIRARFAPEVVRWVKEARPFFAIAEDETADGLLMTFAVRQEEELVSWLLGWGRHVEVLSPASLRQRLAAEAHALLAAHQQLD